MLIIVTAVTLVAGLAAAILLVMFSKRVPRVDELGALSNRWIADHRVDVL
jgi:hypothetical protein